MILKRIRGGTRIVLMKPVVGKAQELHQSLNLVDGAKQRGAIHQVGGIILLATRIALMRAVGGIVQK